MPEHGPSEPAHVGPPASAAAGPGHPQFAHLRHTLGADDELPIDPDLVPEDTRAPSRAHRPHSAPPPSARSARVLAAVFTGGTLGTFGRDAVERAWPQPAGHFPTTTFVVNTTGAFLLGVALTLLLERAASRTHLWRQFVGAGVLGGWTTYSSLVVGADALAKGGHPAVAAGYVATTLLCGVVAVALGIGLGRLGVPAAAGGGEDTPGGGAGVHEMESAR